MDRVEVTFRNMKTSDWLEEDVRDRARKLETFCPDIVACRVQIGIPHRHREHGKRFAVHIDVVVPGEEIAVSHSPMRATKARKDVLQVVRDAFAAAKRQLQDHARRRRLAVKAHSARVAVART